ncbi:hypothetical protein QP157_03790 [Sphingomonas sp. LR61]|uniref:hypothetical protein n=1 Tax=Sphingomonas sp. LR61 TaxID=3050234 RepID=UPI002FE31799
MGDIKQRTWAIGAAITITVGCALTGCVSSGNAYTDRGEGAKTATATPSAPAGLTEDVLSGAVLTTTELPVGGWAEKPSSDSTSDGATSTDAEGPGACGADFSDLLGEDLENTAQSGRDWTRESTGAYLNVGTFADPDAAEHVQAITDAVRGCPTEGSTFTIDGAEETIVTTVKDLGSWGSATYCGGFEARGATTVAGTTCMIAGDGYGVTVLVGAAYSFDVPKDAEVQQIVEAAYQKADAQLG